MTELQKIEKLTPSVSLEQFLDFDPERPETYTSSPEVNTIAKAMKLLRPLEGYAVAEAVGSTEKKISAALEIITGYSFGALRYYVLERQMNDILKERPTIHKDELAHLLGFADHSSFHRFLKSPGFKNKHRVNAHRAIIGEDVYRRKSEDRRTKRILKNSNVEIEQ